MSETKAQNKNRWKNKLAIIIIMIASISLTALLLFRLHTKSELHRKINSFRNAGYPVTCAGLNRRYSIPNDVPNAADLLEEAFNLRKQWSEQEMAYLPVVGYYAEPLTLSRPLDEDIRIRATEYLADNEKTLKLLHQAADIKYCRFPIDFTNEPLQISHLHKLRELANLLKLQAFIAAENDRPDLAADTIRAGFGLARSLSNEPLLISQLVRFAFDGTAVTALKRAVNRTIFTEQQLLNLSRTLKSAEDPNALTRAFVGNICMALDFFNSTFEEQLKQTSRMKVTSSKSFLLLYSIVGSADKDKLRYLGYIIECIKAARLPMHQCYKTAKTLSGKYKSIPNFHYLLQVFKPIEAHAIIVHLRVIGYLRAARTALAVQRFRLDKCKLPETLDALVPAYLKTTPKDPFDGKDIRYRKLDKGFVTYSIGRDQTDNKGKQRKLGSPKHSTYDITFIIEH